MQRFYVVGALVDLIIGSMNDFFAVQLLELSFLSIDFTSFFFRSFKSLEFHIFLALTVSLERVRPVLDALVTLLFQKQLFLLFILRLLVALNLGQILGFQSHLGWSFVFASVKSGIHVKIDGVVIIQFV